MATSDPEIIPDEILYFVTNSLKSRANKKIVEICHKFYAPNEITTSKDKLWEIVKDFPSLASAGLKKISRRGAKESENNLEDVIQWIKVIDDAGEILPRFASFDMTKVPSTDDGSITTSQILAHHDNLRKEYVTIDSLNLCLNNMKADIIASLMNNSNPQSHLLAPPPPNHLPPPPSHLPPPTPPPPPSTEPLPPSSQISLFSQGVEVPHVPDVAVGEVDDPTTTSNLWQNGGRRQRRGPAAASAAASPTTSGRPTHQRKDRSRSQNRQPTIFIGSKVTSGQISFKGADLTVDRYLGRIDVESDNEEIKKFITDAGVKIVDFQENSRTHSSFKSFKISIRKSDLPTLEKDNFWPTGVVFRNFFRPRGQRGDQQRGDRQQRGSDIVTSAPEGALPRPQDGQ